MEFSPLKTLSRPIISSNLLALSSTLRATSHPISSGALNSVSGRISGNRSVQEFGKVQKPVRNSSSGFRRSFGVSVTAMAAKVDVKKGAELKLYEKGSELAEDLAAYVADLSAKAISERGSFTVVLTGGSLFKSMGKLTEEPYIGKVDWSRWHVFWGDERVVPLDHPESNYKLAYDNFLSKVPIPSSQVHAINDKLSPQPAAADYEFVLRQLVKTKVLSLADTGDYPRFDLLLLGMGPDGHMCSLFPHHPLVHKTEVWITSIEDSPKPPPERITFTLPVINSGANVAFVATGSAKADKISLVFGPDLPFGELPAQLVKPYKGHLVWFTDKDAASKL
ncbi:unnamed protein product [Calypogeia fissa]